MNLERELKTMSDAEKIKLIGKIWKSIKQPQLLPVPAEHKKILDERIKDKDRLNGRDWDSFNQLLDQII
jgi:hypothetical protein